MLLYVMMEAIVPTLDVINDQTNLQSRAPLPHTASVARWNQGLV